MPEPAVKGVLAAFVLGAIVGAGVMTLRQPDAATVDARADSLAWNQAVLDTLLVTSERLVPAAARSDTAAMKERATYDTLRAAVTVSEDTVMTPDSRVVDFRLAEMIRAADRVAVTHEAAIDSLNMALAAETARANALQVRVGLLERQLAAERAARPRFGIKTGVAIGAAFVLLLVHAAGSIR